MCYRTQVRFHLPVWLGIGSAINALSSDSEKLSVLQEMHNEWPFFKVNLDMVEMVLAKGDLSIFRMYERDLVEQKLHGFGDKLKEAFEETVRAMLDITRHDDLLQRVEDASKAAVGNKLDSSHLLKARLGLREPYIMLLNVMQARCLKSLRELETTSENGGEREGMKMSELTRLNPKADEYQSALEDSLQISVRGISSGLNNTG